jgi:ParB family chromosome partitioning protein
MTKKPDFSKLAAQQLQRDVSSAALVPDRFQRAQAVMDGPVGPPRHLQPDAIQPRLQSTRELDAAHVEALAQSIRALGLIEPIVVDSQHRLLAGGHRHAAVRQLQETDAESYLRHFPSGIPVFVMELDAEAVPERALEIEIAENEHRRDYTPAEVKALVERLRAAGYRDQVGRPKAGEKALGPALEIVVGKSMKTIRKMLTQAEGAPLEPPRVRHVPAPLEELRRSLFKHRSSVPERLQPALEALLQGIKEELGDG